MESNKKRLETLANIGTAVADNLKNLAKSLDTITKGDPAREDCEDTFVPLGFAALEGFVNLAKDCNPDGFEDDLYYAGSDGKTVHYEVAMNTDDDGKLKVEVAKKARGKKARRFTADSRNMRPFPDADLFFYTTLLLDCTEKVKDALAEIQKDEEFETLKDMSWFTGMYTLDGGWEVEVNNALSYVSLQKFDKTGLVDEHFFQGDEANDMIRQMARMWKANPNMTQAEVISDWISKNL